MKKKRNILIYILAVVLIVGGLLALWLPNRNTEDGDPDQIVANRPDTDPNAPFEDLSVWEKEKVLAAVKEYWTTSPEKGPDKLVWFEQREFKLPDDFENKTERYEYYYPDHYGVKYYGTFNDYDIVMSAVGSEITGVCTITIAGCSFRYSCLSFELLACKDGVAIPLMEVYERGLLSDDQIERIYLCYVRYNYQVYITS